MSRSNQFDPDAYGKPPRKVGCTPMMLMLFVGLSVFMFMRFRAARNRAGDRQDVTRPADTDQGSRAGGRSNARLNENFPRADQDDWSIEEVQPSAQKTTGGFWNENLPDPNADVRSEPRDVRRNPGDRTDRGDWSLEEVDSTKKAPSQPKSTKKGDWEIEEVPE